MIIGIDLGTTYSVGAYVDDKGTPTAIPNSDGEMTTPSVVYFESEDSAVVGQTAKDNSCLHPGNVISLVKNSMGRKNSDGTPIIFHTEFKDYEPEVVSSFILKKVVSDANAYLNPSEPITDVVITKPAYFTAEQVQATKNAAQIAGLKCVDLLNEPTAAAIYYAHKSGAVNSKILVYDLGGGTFDVTIIEIKNGNVEVMATDGLRNVGGSFFDKELVSGLCQNFLNDTGIDLYDKEYADVLQELFTKVEKAKIKLSVARQSDIIIRAGSASKSYTVTREQFEEIVSKLYQKTETKIKQVLRNAELSVDDLDKIILAGGSSRIPFVEAHLKEYFGKEPSKEVNPDEVVALGAAIYAKQITENTTKKVIDVCSHGIGIRAIDPKTGKDYNDILIKKNTKLPASVERGYKTFKANQEDIYINVLEGEYKEITDVSEVCELNVPIPQKLPEGSRVYIKLELDKAQLLHIFLRIPDAGNVETEITFDPKSNMTKDEVIKWKKSVTKAIDSIDEKNGIKPKSILSSIFGDFGNKKDVEANDNSSSSKAVEPKKEAPVDKSKAIPKLIKESMKDVIGMDEVREGMRDFMNRYDLEEKKGLAGRKVDIDACIAVLGKSGMGVTRACNEVVNILNKMGVTSGQKVSNATFDDIVGVDEASTKDNIQNVFQNAINGVLILDDFDEFYDDNENAAGMKAVDMLLKAYEGCRSDIAIVIGGDGDSIRKLFDKKKKFEKLFLSKTIELIGYTAAECVQLVHNIAEQKGHIVDDRADLALEKHFKGEIKLPDFEFINSIDSLVETAIIDVGNKAKAKRHAKQEDFVIIYLENFAIEGDNKSLDELLEELNNLTGLSEVKHQIQEIVNNIKVIRRAQEQGQDVSDDLGTLHMAFLGNAGTGKTTVARIVGAIFRELGVIQRGQFVEVTRADLVAEYVGATAPRVTSKVNEAMGGILFIDEAYDVCRDDNDQFGQEAVNTLIPLLENHRKDFICILAGYTTDIKEFMRKNQGFESRIPYKINFEDYSIDEMMTIFDYNVNKDAYIVEDDARKAVRNLILEKMRDPGFGNARGVRTIYEQIKKAQRSRVAKLEDWGDNEFKHIKREDIAIKDNEDNSVEKLLAELNAMTGLSSVKREVNTLVNLARVNAYKKQQGMEVSQAGTLHMVFTGNPGTGKTTVARKIGAIYKALGLLTKGDCTEISRSGLVGQYVGETAKKVDTVIQNAIGGVLFIDEAYTLNQGKDDSFGLEAINALVANIENHRDNLVVIIAGYTQNMNDFLDVNPGLKSRFPNVIDFEDYNIDELMDIWKSNLQQYTYSFEVEQRVRMLISEKMKAQDFGNGRGVRNICESIIRAQGNRISDMLANGLNPTKEELLTISGEDIF